MPEMPEIMDKVDKQAEVEQHILTTEAQEQVIQGEQEQAGQTMHKQMVEQELVELVHHMEAEQEIQEEKRTQRQMVEMEQADY